LWLALLRSNTQYAPGHDGTWATSLQQIEQSAHSTQNKKPVIITKRQLPLMSLSSSLSLPKEKAIARQHEKYL
jgi:hypothetical protein